MPPKPFKPPRPITQPSTTTSKPKPARTSSSTKSKPKAKAAEKGKGKAKAITVLSDSEDGSGGGGGGGGGDEIEDEVDDIDMLDDTTTTNNMFPFLSSDSDDLDALEVVKRPEPPIIPQKLLARLLHEHFAQADTKITKEAMEGLTKYIEIFAKEAVARACFAKDELGEEEGGMTRDFLEVDDLERLAPQLLLDF